MQCTLCLEDLVSDVEEDENKNIGCDECPRWYHLKCTDMVGLSYNEAAQKDYICDIPLNLIISFFLVLPLYILPTLDFYYFFILLLPLYN